MKKYGISVLLAGLLLTTGTINAAENKTENVKVQNVVPMIDNVKFNNLLNIAGKQRMLSQKIIKDYLYIGKNVAKNKATKELKASLAEFKKAQKELKVAFLNNEEIQNLLEFTALSLDDLDALLKEDFNIENAQIALDLSETLLESSQYLVSVLKKNSNSKDSIVDIAGKQRMLSQRIAKYYIAYQFGIKDKNTIEQTKQAVEDFQANLDKLMKYKKNTPEINKKLNEVNKLWKIVHKFYLNIEKGGLPIIVYNTTDKITDEMNDITKLYEKIN